MTTASDEADVYGVVAFDDGAMTRALITCALLAALAMIGMIVVEAIRTPTPPYVAHSNCAGVGAVNCQKEPTP